MSNVTPTGPRIIPDPIGLRIIPTYRCNYRCSFCYQQSHGGNTLSFGLFKERIESLAKTWRPQYITIMGGEPMLDASLRYKIWLLEHTFEGVPISITTNGSGGQCKNVEECLSNYRVLLTTTDASLTFSVPTVNAQQYTEQIQGAMHTLPDYLGMIACLHTGFPGRASRLNAFMGQEWHDILVFARSLGLQLTLCTDMRGHDEEQSSWRQYFTMQPCIASVAWHDTNTLICTDTQGYQFWVFHHAGGFLHDNVIILPDGTITRKFDDVIAGKGMI